MRIHSQYHILGLVVVWLALAPFAAAQSRLQVAASLHPLYDLVRQLAGADADVERLLPPGISPHDYEPAPSDALKLVDADVIVMFGGADEWLRRLVAAAGRAADTVVITEFAVVRDYLAANYPDEVQVDTDGAVVAFNAHVWLEPLLMSEALAGVAAALAAADPANAAGYEARLSELQASLAELDAELAALLAPVAGAPFVPFHDAWPYFAARYGLDLVVAIEPFPGREPSAGYLVEVLAQIRESGATVIFTETQLGRRPAEVVAESAGVALVELDPVGGLSGRETYRDLLLFNARALLAGLSAERQ